MSSNHRFTKRALLSLPAISINLLLFPLTPQVFAQFEIPNLDVEVPKPPSIDFRLPPLPEKPEDILPEKPEDILPEKPEDILPPVPRPDWLDPISIKARRTVAPEQIVGRHLRGLDAILRKTGGQIKIDYAAGEQFMRQQGGIIAEISKETGAQLETKIKSTPVYKWLEALLEKDAGSILWHFMEPPHALITVGEHHGGPAILYVNGILNTRKDAIDGAKALCDQLRRPVTLLYNPSMLDGHTGSGSGDDISEALYDRAWAAFAANFMRARDIGLDPSIFGHVLQFVARTPRLQQNPTTRQLTHIIYHHGDRPLDIITHSQGCIIARNAFLSAAILGRQRNAENVAWVATGIPLNDNEIFVSPGKTTPLIFRHDPVPSLLGGRGGAKGIVVPDHYFEDHYVKMITRPMLWR